MSSAAAALRPQTFKPGQSGNPGGRKRAWLTRIDEKFAKDGKHPYDLIMAEIHLLSPKDRIYVWLELMSYCQAKPKEIVIEENSLTDMPTSELIKLVEASLEDIKKTA